MRLFDCCWVSGGSAAAIVITPEIAKCLKPNQDILKIKALQIICSSGEVHDCFSITEFVTMEDLHIPRRGARTKT